MKGVPKSDYRFELEQKWDSMQLDAELRANREARLERLTSISVKFPFHDFQTAVKEINDDDGWPSPGAFVAMMKTAGDERIKQASKKNVGGITDFRPIMGYCFDEIMHSREGQRAKARGKPHSFLLGVVSRKISIESLTMTV